MTPAQRDLWQRLEAFAFDEPGTLLTFGRRLARENGWDARYAERVLLEYRRFVFLAQEAGHPVSPSEAVDQAWHLHLTYTESYWQKLCGEVLGRRLHHRPTKGGAQEATKFDGQYAATLASYRRLFGEVPPRDLWPLAEEREHAKGGTHRWIDTGSHWVIPKRAVWFAAAVAALAGFTVVAGGCSSVSLGLLNVFDLRGPQFLIFYGVLCAIAIPLAGWVRQQCCSPHGVPEGRDLPADDYEMAYLAGGVGRVMQTVLVAFHAAGWVEIHAGDPTQVRRKNGPKHTLEGAEAAVWLALPADGGFITLPEVRQKLHTASLYLESQLFAKGLLSRQAGLGTLAGLLILLGAVAVGAYKIWIGIRLDRPVGILLFLTLGMGAVSLIQLIRWANARRSGKGVAALRQLRGKYELPAGATLTTPAGMLPAVATATALFGMTALPVYGMGYLASSLQRLQSAGNSSTGTSCGSSCGGGGGGCGGGGCGGCGGGGSD